MKNILKSMFYQELKNAEGTFALTKMRMKNGFIYEFFNVVILCLNKLNLVELFKCIADRLTGSRDRDELIANKNIAIDIFIVLKWVVIVCFWCNAVNNLFCILLTGYLLFTNIHTYFYYHVWSERAVTNEQGSIDRVRRRFVNLVLAIAFSVVAYAYLYHICYSGHFINWPDNFSSWLAALNFSLTNSIKGSGTLSPITNVGLFIAMSQFISTYIFLAIMLSRSVPQYKQHEGR